MTNPIAWIAVTAWIVASIVLARRALHRSTTAEDFATGGGAIPPWVVGLSLTAQLTSVATFVINPGLVFQAGVSGLLGYGVAAALGITAGLVLFSVRFRRMGARVQALTVPGWIGARFDSDALRGVFSALSFGLVAYAVLIVVALGYVLGALLGVSATAAAIGVAVFSVGFVALGGAHAHARTNAIQAVMMLIVAVVLISRGLPALFAEPGLFATLRAEDPALTAAVNPGSLYFRTWFEVFVCNALVGVAVVCQPHILGKSLYLKDDRDVRRMLGVAVAAGLVFLGVLWVGLYARAVVPVGTPIDRVVPTWIAMSFSPALQVVISLGLLAAGLSTLEGILLALCAIVGIDVVPLVRRAWGGSGTADAASMRWGRGALLAVGVVTVALAHRQIADPTGGSVAIFAQYGVYLLFTASLWPLIGGMFLGAFVNRRVAGAAALLSIAGYVAAGAAEFTMLHTNPAFLATCGMSLGALPVAAAWAAHRATNHGLVERAVAS